MVDKHIKVEETFNKQFYNVSNKPGLFVGQPPPGYTPRPITLFINYIEYSTNLNGSPAHNFWNKRETDIYSEH